MWSVANFGSVLKTYLLQKFAPKKTTNLNFDAGSVEWVVNYP